MLKEDGDDAPEDKKDQNRFVAAFWKSIGQLSETIKTDLKKNDLMKVSLDIAEDLRFSSAKVLVILRAGVGNIFWDAKNSSSEAQKELRRGFFAAKKKLKERWPAVSPHHEAISKNAS